MESLQLDALHLVVGGDALAREDSGRVVFVSGAIPGETVRASVIVAKRDFARATTTEVLAPSPDRVVPPCEAWHRGCGGCDWQHIDPRAQLGYKTSIVAETLKRTARLSDPVVHAFGSVDPWGYRTTIRVAADASGVGFRSRRSHSVVPIETCPVAAVGVNSELRRLGRSKSRGRNEISIRASLATAAVNVSDSVSQPFLEEVVAGQRLRVSIGSFFQSSPAAADLLVDAVAAAVADGDLTGATVVDAYGGIGLFACTVAQTAAHVIVVESSPSACADARHNLAGRNATVIESPVEDWSPTPADVVIADPARAGLDKRAAAVLAATGARVLVLVSCDTGSLARDARLLHQLDYEHVATHVIDAFPNTSHIETVSQFVRIKSDQHSVQQPQSGVEVPNG